jgi:tRNA pseudouridine32 synthase/23S rRNA pseudouridine746 synthase
MTPLRVPESLLIMLIHQDEAIIVVHKPCNLRSVPGNAKASEERINENGKRSRQTTNISAQEAWVKAIESFAIDPNCDKRADDELTCWIQKLALTTQNISGIPRQFTKFERYLQRSLNRLSKGVPPSADLIRSLYDAIQSRQKTFLPKQTAPELSAYGQVQQLLKSKTHKASTNLFVVHRLDCATSGVLLFARTQQAASALGAAWRSRTRIHKTYLAQVREWPTTTCENDDHGTIELPLSPDATHDIKWRVDMEHGKPSVTTYKILARRNGCVTLKLVPVTGRTHQLRIHCAAVGSGIIGDSLYGTNHEAKEGSLRLHAYKLSIPHPDTNETVEYSAGWPSWYAVLESP